MSNFAIVFPGQGSQSIGMLTELYRSEPIVKQVFDQASEKLGYQLWDLVSYGPVEKLNQTEFTQPALLAADVAVYRVWQRYAELYPLLMAGHSLGEYAALVCANSLDFEVAVDLVAKRGRFMQQAIADGEGAMGAVIGLESQQVSSLCDEYAQDEVVGVANLNSRGQVVIAGHAKAVTRVLAATKKAGAKIAKLIPVSVPSHCLLMEPAAQQLGRELEQVEFRRPEIPVIHNIDVKTHDDAHAIRQALASQLTGGVNWVDTIIAFDKGGVNTVIESGPGKVLTGLNKRIVREMKAINMHTIETIKAAHVLVTS